MSKQSKQAHEDVKHPDAFITTSEKVIKELLKYKGLLLATLALILVASLGYLGHSYWRDSQERAAANALFEAEAKMQEADLKRVEARSKDPKFKPDLDAEFAKDLSAPVSEYQNVIKAHAGTTSAQVAALGLSLFLWEQKQFKEALVTLELAKVSQTASSWLDGNWWMHKGVILIENENYDQGISAFELILKNKSLSLFHSEAKLKLGLAYESKGDLAQARQAFEQLEREFPNSGAAKEGKKYLRALSIKSTEPLKTSQQGKAL